MALGLHFVNEVLENDAPSVGAEKAVEDSADLVESNRETKLFDILVSLSDPRFEGFLPLRMRVPLFGKVLVTIRGIEYVLFSIRVTDVGGHAAHDVLWCLERPLLPGRRGRRGS